MSNKDQAQPPQAPAPPVPPAPPSHGDKETEVLLKEYDATLLSDIRGRAEKWAGGLTALTGLLSTALIIKGPAGILDVPESIRVIVAVLIAAALLSLIIATLSIYRAAYGSPFSLLILNRQPLTGLQHRFLIAQRQLGREALKFMRTAVWLTLIGIGILFAAIMLTWFAESSSTGAGAGVCIEANGVTVKLGELQAVDAPHQLTVVPCPG